MRRRAGLGVAALVGAASLFVAGCGVSTPTPTPASSPALQIATPDGPASLRLRDATIALVLSTPAGGANAVTSVPRVGGGSPTVHLYSQGGETGRQVNSFVFGEAPSGAAAVVIQPGGVRGDVTNGLYLVGLPDGDLRPDALTWKFLSSTGAVVAQGAGIQG